MIVEWRHSGRVSWPFSFRDFSSPPYPLPLAPALSRCAFGNAYLAELYPRERNGNATRPGCISRLGSRQTKVRGRFFASSDLLFFLLSFFFFLCILCIVARKHDSGEYASPVPSLSADVLGEIRPPLSASCEIPADFLFRKVPQSRGPRSARCHATRVAPATLTPPVGPGRFF